MSGKIRHIHECNFGMVVFPKNPLCTVVPSVEKADFLEALPKTPGGKLFVYFAERMCTPSQVSVLALLSNAGFQKKIIFLQLVLRYAFHQFFL